MGLYYNYQNFIEGCVNSKMKLDTLGSEQDCNILSGHWFKFNNRNVFVTILENTNKNIIYIYLGNYRDKVDVQMLDIEVDLRGRKRFTKESYKNLDEEYRLFLEKNNLFKGLNKTRTTLARFVIVHKYYIPIGCEIHHVQTLSDDIRNLFIIPEKYHDFLSCKEKENPEIFHQYCKFESIDKKFYIYYLIKLRYGAGKISNIKDYLSLHICPYLKKLGYPSSLKYVHDEFRNFCDNKILFLPHRQLDNRYFSDNTLLTTVLNMYYLNNQTITQIVKSKEIKHRTNKPSYKTIRAIVDHFPCYVESGVYYDA